MSIDKTIKLLEAKNTELNIAVDTYTKTNEQIRKEKDTLLMLEKLKNLIIDVGQKSQKNVLEYIEETVTMALVSVFGNDYKFKIELNNKRDQSEVNFFVEHKGNLLEPRADVLGGGIVDTCAFALRLVIWSLTNSNDSKIFIMDEVFKHVSAQHIPNVSELVKEMSRLLGIQIIIVTHNSNLIENADTIITI